MLSLYRDMVRIRASEAPAAECFTKGILAGNPHLSIGQEAAEAGAFAAIEPRDYFTSTHRGHGHAIARGADPKRAMAELFGTAKKVIGMTATLINGYSSGIFHLLYRTSAQLMLADGKPHEKPALFNTEYGVVETTYTEADESYAAKRRSQKSGVRTRQLPGVSPLVFSRFLLEKTAFLSLSDMGKALPSYEEIPIACRMDEAVQSEYKRIENALVRVLRSDRRVAQKILSAYLNLLTVYPDQPYDQKPIFYPDSDVPIVEPENMGDTDTLGEKEQKTLELVKAAIQNGERALIYTSWVRTDSQQKLKKLLTDEGYRTEILTDKIKTTDREEWVQKKLAAGMQVLIVNPSLVETGLDLNAFTTLVFYSMGYKLFTLRQASRRSWRINQKAPAVKVYMLYYEDTMQQKCLKLMASKLAVAGLIEGNFSEEGLAAMSDVQDMTSQMAKELMLGIRDNVEDIAAAFKKMAFENPDREVPEVPAKEAALPLPAMIEQPKRVFTVEQEEKLQAAMVQLEQQKAAMDTEVRLLQTDAPELKLEHFQYFAHRLLEVQAEGTEKILQLLVNQVIVYKDRITVLVNLTDKTKTPPLEQVTAALRERSCSVACA